MIPIELAVLKLFIKNKDIYIKYKDIYIKTEQDKEIKLLYNLIELYYKKYQEHTYISKDELYLLYNSEYPGHKHREVYEELIDKLYSLDVSRDITEELIHNLVQRDFANQLLNKVLPVVTGQDQGDNFESVKHILSQYESYIPQVMDESPFTEMDIDSILDQAEQDGLQFRLKCLRNGLGSLSGGTLGHLFARPETGKTSFCHSEVAYIASQLTDNDCVLWFNNEEAPSKIIRRKYSAITGMSEDELSAKRDIAKEIYQREGGYRIKLVDEAVISIEQIEKLCLEYRPRLVIIDQGDKVHYKGSKDAGNGAEKLKAIYDQLREVVKRCNKLWKMDMLTVGQADVDAQNKRVLTLANLDSGKTGKAGAFDYVIGIGHELGKDNVRYVTFCKNKLKGNHATYLVTFDNLTGRYND